MKHNQKIPTGVEIIYRTGLENQILIEIPKTNFHLLGTKRENGNFDVGILNQLGCYKRKIAENIKERDFAILITNTLKGKNQENFKSTPTINRLKNHYKSLLKQLEYKHNV